MDTTFLSYLLGLCLIIILIAYLYQTTTQNAKNSNSNKKLKNSEAENLRMMMINNYNEQIQKAKQNKSIHKKNAMPIHPVGPVHNFHQHFNKYKNMPGVGYPTGIPEMGWRNLFLSNYSQNQVVLEDSFAGIPTRNFLDNLDNVKNKYRKECLVLILII